MRRDAAASEAKLGPRPPDDPSIVRKQPNGTFIEFLARQEKEKMEKKEQETKMKMERSTSDVSSGALKSSVAGLPDMETAMSAQATTISSTQEPPFHCEPQLPTVPLEPYLSIVVVDTVSAGQLIVPDLATSDTSAASSNELESSTSAPIADVPQLSAEETAARQVADQYIIMARAYLDRKDADQALKQLGKAVKRAPSYAESYLVRGQVYLAARRTEKAVEDFMKVFSELDPSNEVASSSLKQIASDMALQGQMASAMQLLTAVNATLPRDKAFSLSLAVTLGNQGNYEQALAVLDNIVPQCPSTAQRVGLYVQLYELQGDVGKAERVLSEAATETLLPCSEVGEWHLRRENLVKAVDAFERHLDALSLKTEIETETALHAVVHKKVGSIYSRMYDATATGADVSATSTTHSQQSLLKALHHFNEAMKGGVYDVETRKFFARHPHLSEQRAESNEIATEAHSLSGSAKQDLHVESSVEATTGDGKNEQEILLELQGFEPNSVIDSRDTSDRPPISEKTVRAMDVAEGPAEGSLPSTTLTAAATGVLHSRRSRWVVRQLATETASPFEAARTADAPADTLNFIPPSIHGTVEGSVHHSDGAVGLERNLLSQQSAGVDMLPQSDHSVDQQEVDTERTE